NHRKVLHVAAVERERQDHRLAAGDVPRTHTARRGDRGNRLGARRSLERGLRDLSLSGPRHERHDEDQDDLHQKPRRSDNCITRASPARLEMTPAVAFTMLLSGRPRFARLNRLNTSRRTVVLKRPVISTRRCRLMSTDSQPGPRSVLRPALPNTPDVTRVYAAGLNHCSTVCAPFGSPVRFGRPVAPAPTLLFPCVTVYGRPVRALRMPLTSQPPRI